MMKVLKEEIKRDYELFKELKKIYELEWQRTALLNDKAINIATSTGIILTLFMGLGTFSLERILPTNQFYMLLIAIQLLGIMLLITAILVSLYVYRSRSYEAPDPRKFINEYKNRSLKEYIHFYGGDVANSIYANSEVNNKRSGFLRHAFAILFMGILMMGVFTVLILIALQVSLS